MWLLKLRLPLKKKEKLTSTEKAAVLIDDRNGPWLQTFFDRSENPINGTLGLVVRRVCGGGGNAHQTQ